MKYIAELLALLLKPAPQSELDRFVSSKNPTTSAEVNYWVTEFDRKKSKGWSI